MTCSTTWTKLQVIVHSKDTIIVVKKPNISSEGDSLENQGTNDIIQEDEEKKCEKAQLLVSTDYCVYSISTSFQVDTFSKQIAR